MATATLSTDTLAGISQALREFANYVEENDKRISEYNIDTDCLNWHIECVEACLDRIACREHKGE